MGETEGDDVKTSLESVNEMIGRNVVNVQILRFPNLQGFEKLLANKRMKINQKSTEQVSV